MTNNSPISVYVHKMDNRITFKINIGYYLELLTSEMMKLLESTKNKIKANENGENLPQL